MRGICNCSEDEDETKMIRFLQINLNGCQAAQDLMAQVAEERRADLVIISEQYRNALNRWYSGGAGSRSAIYAPSAQLRVTAFGTDSGGIWTWVELQALRIYSCYFSPNSSIVEFTSDLNRLEDDVKTSSLPVILAGDFNAKAPEWGSSKTDRRGVLLSELASHLHLHVANIGSSLTFVRGGSGSVIDVTFADEEVVGGIRNWQVLETYSHSDHRYISFEAGAHATRPQPYPANSGWGVRKLNLTALDEAVAEGRKAVMDTIDGGAGTEDAVRSLNRLLKQCCDASMVRRSQKNQRRPVYWWTDTIADLRRECLYSRRRAQRKPRNNDYQQIYQDTRKALRNAIKESKARCWAELCTSVNEDPWGMPYKIVRKKLRTAVADPYLEIPANLESVINGLFPHHPAREQVHLQTTMDETVSPFSEAELLAAAERIKTAKAPGPDCVPNAVIKRIAQTDPALLLAVFNTCLLEGTFASPWKRQKLVLIPKSKATPSGPSSYRPLCMLDGAGKLLERLILQRLQNSLENDEKGLSNSQYGFRPGRSTIDAIAQVVSTIRLAWQGSVKASKHALLVTLDVKNAFNTANWEKTLRSLVEIDVPANLIRIIESYFSERVLEYECSGKKCQRSVSAGVPQGSVLGPALWNAMYDGLLKVNMPEEARLVAFADDVAILVTAKRTESLRLAGEEAIRRVKGWLDSNGLQLAVHKTEAVFFTRRRKLLPPKLEVDNFVVPFSRSLRYLGVQIDDKLRFTEHVEKAASKATAIAEDLARLMPNTGGPKHKRRKLYSEVVHSVLLYGAPIWADATKKERTKLTLARVQRRSALRVASAYRTVSGDAILVLTAIPPIDLLAAERQAVYNGQKRVDARELTMQKWQERWDASAKGRWTHRLIGELMAWYQRKHGELCYHLTQLLTGHGCFGSYLHKIGKEVTCECHHCGSIKDDAEHTLFACPAWEEARNSLKIKVGEEAMTLTKMVPSMLENAASWSAWVEFASSVMQSKEEEERSRRGEKE
jgi:endonuclease/exonuclease/phosphatase family metal-dependent hydrolase